MATTNLAYNTLGQGYSASDTSSLSSIDDNYIFAPAQQLANKNSNNTDLQNDQPNSSMYSIKHGNEAFDSLIPKIPKMQPFRSTFTPLQEWDGYVIEIGGETFTARLIDITALSENEHEEADFPISELSDRDRQLLCVGAIFRWAIGYRKSNSGTKQRVSSIVFRRLPAWTSRELDENRKKAELLAASLQGE
jgi:hypothetical protein